MCEYCVYVLCVTISQPAAENPPDQGVLCVEYDTTTTATTTTTTTNNNINDYSNSNSNNSNNDDNNMCVLCICTV